MPKRRWTLPLALGLITAVLLIAALWPKAAPQRTVVVAARDLGAGATLTVSDLTAVTVDATQAPADALAEATTLIGQTLAVVRFTGEPITPRHLGAAVTLEPNERGIAIKVAADTGLAGILRPGMKVGVIATLGATGASQTMYAKTVLEGLRVLYVSPDFQARPYTPATASATVSKSNGGAFDGGTPAAAAGTSGTVKEGTLVLAAGTVAQSVRYETITDTLKIDSAAVITGTGTLTPTAKTPAAVKPGQQPAEPPTRWVVPVELLAALNAAGDSLTLTLLPEAPQAYTTVGTQLTDVYAANPEGQP